MPPIHRTTSHDGDRSHNSRHSHHSRDHSHNGDHHSRNSHHSRDSGHRSGNNGHGNGTSSSSSPTHQQSPKSAFRECLTELNLPFGLLSSVLDAYKSCDSRLWLLDNSSAMKVRDSHVVRRLNKTGSGATTIVESMDNVTRWEELYETVTFHAKMAAHCWIPTKYWLVNREDHLGSKNHKFSLCWDKPSEVPNEMTTLKSTMKHVTLNQSTCPLADRVHSLAKGIHKEASHLEARDRTVTLVLCTQGLPTDSKGQTGSAVRREFQQELYEVGKLPVKVIIRLTTDDEKVRDMFNMMDSRFDNVDVLDDFWGEAMEVYLHNPWLTYSIGLHRLREAGFAPEVIDDIDERPLNLDEIHQLCTMLFLGEHGGTDLPHPKRHWSEFMRTLRDLVEKETPQWNPVKKATTPWINLRKLDAMHGRRGRSSTSSSTSGHPRRASQDGGTRERRQRHTIHNAQQFQPESSRSREPPADEPRSNNRHGQEPRQRRQTVHSRARTAAPPKDLTLTEVIARWSHQPPDHESTYYPLAHLLVTVPDTFPPKNTKVEPHEYFAKWKTIEPEAFEDEDEDTLKELLKKAVRKAKFFLHPDKLPKDLTENQATLFRSIWDVLAEQESKTLG